MANRKQSKTKKQRKQIKRQTRHFQLRVEHPKDAHVKEILDYAKSQRREETEAKCVWQMMIHGWPPACAESPVFVNGPPSG